MSTDVVAFMWGTAYLDADFPIRYDSNLLWLEGAPRDLSLDGLLAEGDRILGGAGLAHRRVAIDDAELATLVAPALLERGWTRDLLVLMVFAGEPERPHDLDRAAPVGFEEVRGLLEEVTRREPWGSGEGVARQLTDYRGKLERVAGARFVATRVDGELAASCELYVDGPDAQIESVTTLEEFRGKGAASAVVLKAAAIARAEGAEWIHLFADAEDWPQVWYRRLGFRDAGASFGFTLPSPTTGTASEDRP
jgi:ribosomal protein S18 acetylase RimI-like enzyme